MLLLQAPVTAVKQKQEAQEVMVEATATQLVVKAVSGLRKQVSI